MALRLPTIPKQRRSAKQGQLFQVAFAIVFLVFAAVGILLVSYILNNFFAAIGDAGYNETPAIQSVQTSSQMIPSALDFGMVMMVVGLTIGLIITSFLIPSHPIFIVVNIVGIFVLAVACMGISNMYGEMIAGEGAMLGGVADSLPISVFIMQYLPYLAVLLVLITSLVMFAKGSQQQGGGYG